MVMVVVVEGQVCGFSGHGGPGMLWWRARMLGIPGGDGCPVDKGCLAGGHLAGKLFGLELLMFGVPHNWSTSCLELLIFGAPHGWSFSYLELLMFEAPHVWSSSCLELLMFGAPHV